MISPAHTTPVAAGLTLALVVGFAAVSAAAALLDRRAGIRARSAHAMPKQERFTINGRLARPLRPGKSGALNLRLTNPHRYSLRVTRLNISLSVDRAHARAGCARRANFRIQRLGIEEYPIRLYPRRTRSLYRSHARPLPRLIMRKLPTNQDACKKARIRLRFTGRANRWHARARR